MAFAHSFPIDGTKPQDDDAFSNNAGLSRPEAANGERDGAKKSSLTVLADWVPYRRATVWL
jgi:hypothetical protein